MRSPLDIAIEEALAAEEALRLAEPQSPDRDPSVESEPETESPSHSLPDMPSPRHSPSAQSRSDVEWESSSSCDSSELNPTDYVQEEVEVPLPDRWDLPWKKQCRCLPLLDKCVCPPLSSQPLPGILPCDRPRPGTWTGKRAVERRRVIAEIAAFNGRATRVNREPEGLYYHRTRSASEPWVWDLTKHTAPVRSPINRKWKGYTSLKNVFLVREYLEV